MTTEQQEATPSIARNAEQQETTVVTEVAPNEGAAQPQEVLSENSDAKTSESAGVETNGLTSAAMEVGATAGRPVKVRVKEDRQDGLFWNLCLGLIGLAVVAAGYVVYRQFEQLPDPIAEAKAELAALNERLRDTRQQLRKQQSATKPKVELLELITGFEHTIQDIEDQQEAIEGQKSRMAAIRGETRAYFNRYRQETRRKVRGMKFDVLKTEQTGRTFLNVEISRVDKNGVRITHEQGAITIPASDLPEKLRKALAYGDPLNIRAMNRADAARSEGGGKRVPPVKTAPTVIGTKKQGVFNPEPSVGKPMISTPTYHNPGPAPATGPGSQINPLLPPL